MVDVFKTTCDAETVELLRRRAAEAGVTVYVLLATTMKNAAAKELSAA